MSLPRFLRLATSRCGYLVPLLVFLPWGCGYREAESASARGVHVLGGVRGETASGPGHLFFPRSVAVNSRGEICVVDKSGRIQWFGRDGQFLRSWLLPEYQRGQPTGINFDSTGRLLVADSHYQRVLVYAAPTFTAPEGLSEVSSEDLPEHLPEEAPGILLTFGEAGEEDGQFTLVRDVIEDARGFFYAGDYNGRRDRIMKFSPEGKFVLAWGVHGSADGEFQRPQGLAIERRDGGQEFVLVADSCNHRVQRFTTDGRFVDCFGSLGSGPGQMKYPHGVAVAPPGTPDHPAIYVVEWGNNRVQRFDSDGRPTGSWGRPGHDPGELATPWDVTVAPDGHLLVADYGNHRVQIFDPAAGFGQEQKFSR